jgi:hypothetical protein
MVLHGCIPGSQGHIIQGLSNPPHGRNINGLFSDGASLPDSSRVLSGAALHHRLTKHLHRVPARHQMDDLERLSQDPDRQHLLTTVASREHQAVHQTLHNRTLNFSKFLHLVTTSSVRNRYLHSLCRNCDIVFETNVVYLIKKLFTYTSE